MTREELWRALRPCEWEHGQKCITHDSYDNRRCGGIVEILYRALETAWVERDANAIKLRATISERDTALMEGNALTVEKDGMQILIDELRKGHDRYETARRLTPSQWEDAWMLSLNTGKPFDEIIDDLRPFVIGKQSDF